MNAEARHNELIHSLPCVLHWKRMGEIRYGVEGHHPDREYPLIQVPLCHDCHQGPVGVHGLHRRRFEATYKVNDLLLMQWTLEAIYKFGRGI